MAFTTDSLMSHRIPEVRQCLTKRDSVLYALSVGFGQDPLDTRQLDFVDGHRPLKAVPTMSVVLAHPGFWMADPATGIDAVRVVHGEQRIALHRPLPVEEMVVAIFAGVRGYLDKFELGQIGKFEAQLIADMKAREPGIIDAIRTDLEIKPETEKKLVAFLDNFSKTFA